MHASDTFFARYNFVTYLLTYEMIELWNTQRTWTAAMFSVDSTATGVDHNNDDDDDDDCNNADSDTDSE